MAKQVQFRWSIYWPHTEEAKGGQSRGSEHNNHIQVKNFPIVEPTFIAKKLGIIRDINDALFSRLISNDFQIRKSTRYDRIACVITVRKGFFLRPCHFVFVLFGIRLHQDRLRGHGYIVLEITFNKKEKKQVG